MSYHALARKYRPATFAAMVGQEHVTRTLRAALKRDKLSHAYLFSGPRGCGKTTVARLLAKALNCRDGAKDEPCGRCETCQAIAAGTWLDVLEIDAASHTGVDNIRELRDMAQYTPSQGASRVFIIDEVHMLSKGAFNALLKILEEPPARVFFFFATTEPNKIPRTILSRCQRFDFRLLTREELTARLTEIAAAEGAALEPGALRLIVAQAEGSMRDALSALDQVLAACDGEVTEQAVVDLFGLVRSDVYAKLNEAVLAHDAVGALRLADEVVASGQSLDDFARDLVENFRCLLLLRIDPSLAAGINLPAEQIAVLEKQGAGFAVPDLLALLDRATRGFERIHRSGQPRVHLEAMLVELALMESRVMLSDLVRRLDALTGGGDAVGGGGGARPARGAAASKGGSGTSHPARGASRARDAAADDAPAAPTAAASTVEGWQGFVQTLMSRDPALGACVLEGMPAEREGGIVLAYPSGKEFQMQQLLRDLPRLDAAGRELLGRPIVLERIVDVDTDGDAAREALRRAVAPTELEAFQRACGADRALGDLARLLDAEPLPAEERESWHDATQDPDAAPAGD